MKIRNTKQKQTVIQVLQEAECPLTVPEVLARGKKILSSLSLATVYREISRLIEAGGLHTVTIPGDPPRYETDKHHHHHFKCTGCDKVYEIEGCLKELKSLVPAGFRAVAHDLTFYGLCRTCN
jgi:Fur family ferric uptake transcriptional regulator